MYDVITVGSSTIDVFADVESELIKIKSAHHEEELIAYPSGSKILIENLEFLTGGGGTNTAVAFSKLGLKVGYMGMIGSDSNAALIKDTLHENNIDFLGATSELHSGYSIILDNIEQDRTILAYKGANNAFDFSKIDKKKLKTKWFYFSSMVDKAYESLGKVADFAKKKGISVAFNPSNYLAKKGHAYLSHILEKTDLLILNKEEAMLISDKKQMKAIISQLKSFGPKQVVVTDGSKGVYTLHNKKLLHATPNDIEVAETTGAGDAFAATFLAARIKKKSIREALQIAIVNAESVIQNKGAKNGLMAYRSLLKKVRQNTPKTTFKK